MGNLHGWVKYMEICFKWIRNTWLQCSVKFSSHVSMFQQFSKKLLISSCCRHGILKNNNLLPNHQIFFCAVWNQKYFSSTVLRLRGWLLMTPWHGFHLFHQKKKIWLIPSQRTSPWLANFSSISAAVCLLIGIFNQGNKFSYLKSISSFSTFACFQIFQNFYYCHAI